MIHKLYDKYFQKSKSFLYPALGIKRSTFFPKITYMSVDQYINIEDVKLICTFENDTSSNFSTFEKKVLFENSLFIEKLPIKEQPAYVFNLEPYESDWFNVILGRYSKLSAPLKKAIKLYYGENSAEYQYIDTYLHPEKYYQVYADFLSVEPETLKKVGELCNSPDLEKENLKLSAEELGLILKKQ